jgi:hypothetical protein
LHLAVADGSAFKPIVMNQLIDDLNQGLATTNLEIAPDSAVVIEAYGGHGRQGENVSGDCGVAQGGSGGPPGYARTILVVSDLPDELWIYPGESGSNGGAGGAGTVLSSIDLVDLTAVQLSSSDPADLVATGILAIAGGGGGKGNLTNDNTECHHGGDGGAGGSAIADISEDAVGAGGDGTRGTPGGGGEGTGGSGNPAGTEGIGGPGGISYNEASGTGIGRGPLWAGWSTSDNPEYASDAWDFGAGAFHGSNAGSGGGGFGGGGAADGSGDAHKGGGGGGGSFAMPATLLDATIDGDLIYGPSTAAMVIVSFQVVPVE